MKKITMQYLITLWLLSVAMSPSAESIMIGKNLPIISLPSNAGQLVFNDGKLRYLGWNTESLQGRTHLLYIVAARMGVDKINEPLLDALLAAGGVEAFPDERVRVVSILNIDDVMPFGGGFAKAAFEHARKQKENQHAVFVLDDRSATQQAWGFSRKGSAVIIVDEQGVVLRYKDGALSGDEIEDYVALLSMKAQGE
ncbi:hypothetical protein IB286_03705 [Spongiibacter sp. KMU-158]|uniref:YtfJ family protein n=1 Tax=Spongiibacter pelagi TaxID=2760804 RepID=A0A927C1U8_9GAMM|nr:YtfJ family protein [Spongiibacter pelagi]MBD2858101.1 hypothetical protein [Spongiibacter pelagi]